MISKSKRSQNEMMGFVVIVVLVAVIGVIFLSISLRNPAEIKQESREINNFLQASLYHTTTCESSGGKVYDFEDSIKSCYKEEHNVCLNGEDICETMEKTVSYLLESSWQVGEEAYRKGYKFSISSLVLLEEGNKTSSIRESQIKIPVSGELINMTLVVYY